MFPCLVGHAVRVLQPKVSSLGQRRLIQRGLQRLVLGPAYLVDRIAQVLGDMKLVERDLGPGIRNVRCCRTNVGRPHVHRHRLELDQHLGRLSAVPSIKDLPAAAIGHVQHAVARTDDRHVLMSALKRGFVDPDSLREGLLSPRQSAANRAFLYASNGRPAQIKPLRDFGYRRHLQPVNHQRLKQRRQAAVAFGPSDRHLTDAVLGTRHARHFGDQPGLVLAGIQMAPLARSCVVARTTGAALRTGQSFARVADMDGHTRAGQVDLHIGNLPGCLDAKNLAVELTVMHRTGLESGPADSLPESINPHKTGKSHKSLRIGKGKAVGSCGELIQGFDTNSRPFHVTCPILKSSTVNVTIREAESTSFPNVCRENYKLIAACRAALERLHTPQVSVSLEHWSDLHVGKGMGSSTADIVAAARAIGNAFDYYFSESELADIACSIESSDGTMYGGVNIVNHKTGERIRKLQWFPDFRIVLCIPPNTFNTESADFSGKERLGLEFKRLLEVLQEAEKAQDVEKFGYVCLRSAELNQSFLPNPIFSRLESHLGDLGALGMCVGHTGTVVGVLFAGEDATLKASNAVFEIGDLLPSKVEIELTRITAGGYK